MDEPEAILDAAKRLLTRTRMMRDGEQSVIGMPKETIADQDDDSAAEEQAAAAAQIDMATQMLKQVNAYLAKALSDLELARCDLRNLIEISDLAAVFVDSHLKIRRFTAPLRAIYDVSLSDIGTPLSQISASLRYSELGADFDRVCRGERLVERRLVSADGRSHYLMRMRAYDIADGSTDGVAIIFASLPGDDKKRVSRKQAH